MPRIMITGAFGNVGRSAVAACLEAGDSVTLFEADTGRNRRLARSLLREWDRSGPAPRLLFGDIRDPEALRVAVAGQEAVVHLAAIIPPAADRFPELARTVNVEGTRNLLAACRAEAACRTGGGVPGETGSIRFVHASSIAAYGDRVDDYWIGAADTLRPSPGDAYAASKIEAEGLVRGSGLEWTILRLSYVVWRKKLARDPLMFHMPLRTKLEVCHTEDAGRAFARAARLPAAVGRVLDIGGGESCRTDYRDYLDRMLRLLGLGGAAFLPESAFAASGFHCGWLRDSDEAEALLGFRRKGLEDYYAEVREEGRGLRLAGRLFGRLIKAKLLASSEFLSAGGSKLPLRA